MSEEFPSSKIGQRYSPTRHGTALRATSERESLLGEAFNLAKENFPEVQVALDQLKAAQEKGIPFQLDSISRQLLGQLPKFDGNLPFSGLDASAVERLNAASVGELQNIVNSVLGTALKVNSNPQAEFAAWVAASAVVSIVGGLYMVSIEQSREEIPKHYDVEALREYWSKRPLASLRRSTAVSAKILSWLGRVLFDMQGGQDGFDAGAPARAKELKEIISRQGPAFIKVGQGLAIRPDLLPDPYMEQLQELLDRVEPFGREEAVGLIERELGCPIGDVFEDARAFDAPVAAASIGQVYKARLRNGPGGSPVTVAVKCQRPDILESVTLDILTMRGIAEMLSGLPGDHPRINQVRSNAEGFIAVIDVTAGRFMEELDYVKEMENSIRFEAMMNAVDAVNGMIKVPKVFDEVSSRYVMVSEWIDGKKLTHLSQDTSEEGIGLRRDVVTKLLYSYMVQFLETGFLHADPHPGNFLVMEDGRLCIMDYGMMTEITEDQRLAFVEYMAHLSARQYNKTLDDLVRLGFVPEELGADPEKRAIVAPVLAETLETLYSTGGGMTSKMAQLQESQKSRVAALSEKLEEIGREYPLQLPPYFVLILRAFGTLEGLGLGVDENFAVVDECFPYIARRMLSDDNPRVRESLRTFIYNSEDRLDIDKLQDVAKGFSSFTNTMDADTAVGGRSLKPGQLDAATRDLLQLLFSPEGNYVQDLLIDEAVRAVDALSRDAVVRLWQRLAASAPVALALALVPSPLGPPAILVPGANTIPLLSILASRSSDAIALSPEDEANLATLQRLAGLLAAFGGSNEPNGASTALMRVPERLSLSQEQIVEAQAGIQTLLQLTAPGASSIAQRFAQKMSERLAERFQADVSNISLSLNRL
uniref:Protein kinase domain-containing protein n=1 Tax=Tetraselmis sp. GSL018 TaxID=582737 RepID=A0A061R4U8_9CHLO|eukprot:CAMPEP_0177603394 /NCGR_PEP_ID=MMETSP0419_2-20121207/15484_1 /TAXON_ID=582737 /ORGANISM="Tetraselmis sp., Strain GSL018" /LENGTH=876 /DNA_ID=CAMNT_0019097153 /DNA_START=246 /DNA_END=2876 /DNA_ORIENTATION=+